MDVTVSWNQLVVGLSDLWMLAQAEEAAGTPPADAAPAETAKPANGGGLAESPFAQLIPMVVIGIFFYFIVIRPQLKAQKDKRKQHDQMMSSLKKNDKVVTIGGIIGTVAEVTDDRVTLKVDDSTRMKFTRNSIQDLFGDKKDEGGS